MSTRVYLDDNATTPIDRVVEDAASTLIDASVKQRRRQ